MGNFGRRTTASHNNVLMMLINKLVKITWSFTGIRLLKKFLTDPWVNLIGKENSTGKDGIII